MRSSLRRCSRIRRRKGYLLGAPNPNRTIPRKKFEKMASGPRIAIIGAGIGGLTLGVALTKLDVLGSLQVDIYESTANLAEIGAGISLWPRGWEILKNLGLDTALAKRASPGDILPEDKVPRFGFIAKKSDQKSGTIIAEVKLPGGSISYHRADVQEVLLDNISPFIKFHLSHRLKTYRQTDDNVEVEFHNGVIASCDLLVGADGINSVVRRMMLAEGKDWTEEQIVMNGRPVWTGELVYRQLIDSDVVRRAMPDHGALRNQMMYAGKNKHIVGYPVLQGKFVNVAVFISDRQTEGWYLDGPQAVEGTTNDLMSQFVGWDDEASILLKNLKNISKPSVWAIQKVNLLDTYSSGKVLLLGDSAHAMQPHLGSGASQAIEDAYVLSSIICKAVQQQSFHTRKIAEIYSSVRQPFGNFVVNASRSQGLLYELASPGFEDINDGDEISRDRLDALGKDMAAFEWAWGSAYVEVERALSML